MVAVPLSDLFGAMEATWPPVAAQLIGPWKVRQGGGGGKRVAATSAIAPVAEADLPIAEAAMAALGQALLFVLRPEDTGLDALLAARGYRAVDPVVIYAAAAAPLAAAPWAAVAAIAHWPPLEIVKQIWADGGIGPARLAVMDRVAVPKTAILGRSSGRAAGAAFVAAASDAAFVHALEVRPALRRQGTAANIMKMAAKWAVSVGASQLALAVTEANAPARHLYASLGMTIVGTYHYRQK